MKKVLVFFTGLMICSVAFSSNVPTISNHGFPLNVKTAPKETVLTIENNSEQATSVANENSKTVSKKVQKKAIKLNKEEKKELKSAIKDFKKMDDSQIAEVVNSLPENSTIANASETDEVVLVLLSIFIPPLAVYLNNGIGNEFWIDLILTILGWVPGMVYALLLCLGII